jgi:ribonuclease Y
MSLWDYPYLWGAVCLGAGSALTYWRMARQTQDLRKAAELKEKSLLESAQRQADATVREARLLVNEEAVKLREDSERSYAARLQQISEIEARLTQREALINQQFEILVEEEKTLQQKQRECQQKTEGLDRDRIDLHKLVQQHRDQLAAIARLTEQEARARLLKEVELDTLREAGQLAHRIIEEARTRAEEKARHIICLAIQRYAADHTSETTTATIALPDEEMKGRIIGREGRNIRAFEAATGVTVLIDDTPNAVVLSAFDPVRREIARECMQRLLQDGRIHPTRIEEVAAKVTQEINEAIVRTGEEAVLKAGLPPMHPEIVHLLGQLRFRHSFTQNLLVHSMEVAHMAGLMAAELGLDTTLAKRAGLLHDIGKAVNHEMEGTHALVGAELLRRCGEPEMVVKAVACHHDEAPADGPLSVLVAAADAISASRPGARTETMTTYFKRVENLEKIGASFPGVDKCYALQAGRELRVMVRPDQIGDEEAYLLARRISRRIEEDLHYPGQIRVTVIRETRCVEFAK